MGSRILTLAALCTIYLVGHEVRPAYAMVGLNVHEVDRYPVTYIVSFLRLDLDNIYPPNNHFCTGVLVTKRHVLSAAGCIRNRLRNETYILAGTNSLFNGNVFFIQWWLTYEEWATSRRRRFVHGVNDLSISKLNDAVDDTVPIARISTQTAMDFIGTDAVISGWGISVDNRVSDRLLAGTVRILPKQECEDKIANLENRGSNLDVRFLCSNAEPFVLLSPGDFGGPLIVGDYIIGINKETRPFQENYFHPNKINIHMNLEFYRSFIAHTTTDTFRWR